MKQGEEERPTTKSKTGTPLKANKGPRKLINTALMSRSR